MSIVIGIDGGGTKTLAAASDENGSVIAQAKAGPTNPNAMERTVLAGEFKQLFTELEKQLSNGLHDVSHVFAGVAGTAHEANQKLVEELIIPHLSEATAVQVQPDIMNALYSGTFGTPGIVQIAGTGSIAYGLNSCGQSDRVSGWGYLLGDEGSGFDIGRQGLLAALKSCDGRGQETMILPLLYDHFEAAEPQQLINKVYGAAQPNDAIASSARIVFHAYKQGDPAAEGILDQAALEIARNIRVLLERLFAWGERVPVVLAGGIFSDKAVMVPKVQKLLEDRQEIQWTDPALPPVGGSLIGACKMDKTANKESFIQQLIESFQESR
ncbi:N-acetylglucosamine kinase [Virgibacillus xinjiangensis]|uniref:N-acetylglucosamine kinase n=1 Tax=Virgibacillus xinjiangensis TaxID=393090 RepID=A0ABV7CZG9_9BACI